MSWWTYIHGAVKVSVPGRTQAEIQYILDTVLAHLPVVTGSERDMVVHAVRCDGYNSSSSCDEFGMRTNNLVDDYGDRTRRRGWLQTQDQYLLVIEAHLRDRYFDETKQAFMKWLCRLSKRVWVDDVLVRIWDYSKSWTIDDMKKFQDMEEPPSWSFDNKDGEPCWWEFLMWERDPRSDLPLMIAHKYFDDKYIDEEVDRRNKWQEEIENANR